MPFRVNGCGTWYYGRRNEQKRDGVCSACGAATMLHSYETTKCICVLFIPIIPLGKLQILDECGRCQQHRAAPLKAWQDVRRALQETVAAYRAAAGESEKAKELIAVCVECRDSQTLESIVPEIERNQAKDGEALALLGRALAFFGKFDESRRILTAAVARDDQAETRRVLGSVLLAQGRPEEAEPHLKHIIDQRLTEEWSLLFELGQRYQMQGQHERALQTFASCLALRPALAKDASFVRLREESTQKLGTQEQVQPAKLLAREQSRRGWRRAAVVAASLVVLAGLGYTGLAWALGHWAKVYLVNGLQCSYGVRINGAEYGLAGGEVKAVRIAEGPLHVETPDLQSQGPQDAAFSSPFWLRPLSKTVTVINPDRTAVLTRRAVQYIPQGGGQGPVEERQHLGGELLWRVAEVDDAFCAPPASVEGDHGASVMTRYVLQAPSEYQLRVGHRILRTLHKELGEAKVRQLAQRHLLLEPERTGYLSVFEEVASPQEQMEFLATGLERRPMNVRWHQAYQSSAQKVRPLEELDQQYARMLAAEPDNADLQFLAGEVSLDPQRTMELIRLAASAPKAPAHAHLALLDYQLSLLQLEQAPEQAAKLLGAAPDDPKAQETAWLALLASGRAEQLLEALHGYRLPADQNSAFESDLAAANMYAMIGQPQGVQRTIAALQKRLQEGGTPAPTIANLVAYVEAEAAYCQGHPEPLAALWLQSDSEQSQLHGHLLCKDLPAAEEAWLQTEGDARGYGALLLLLHALESGDEPMIQRQRAKVVAIFETHGYLSRAMAAALQGKPAVSVEQLLAMPANVGYKLPALIAVGLSDPAAKDACFAMARKLNFDKRYPYLLYERLLRDSGAAKPATQPAR